MTSPQPLPDPQALARDWITLVQSELAALAVDREAQEQWQSLLGLWAAAATAIVQALPRGGGDGAGAPAAPRSAPAATAPDARDAEIERLRGQLGALEQRLARLERGGHGPGRRRPGPHARSD